MALGSVIEDERLRYLHISNVAADLLCARPQELVGVVTDGHGHVSVEGGGAERCAIHKMSRNGGTQLLLAELRLNLNDGHVSIDLLSEDLLHRGRREFRLGRLNRLRCNIGNTVLTEAPVSRVLEPVVLLVKRVAGEVENANRGQEVSVELSPVNVEARSVQGAEAGGERLVAGLISPQSRDRDGSATESSLDHACADRMRADLQPHGLFIDGARLLSRNKATEEIHSFASMIAKIGGVDRLALDQLAEEGGNDRHLRGVECNRLGKCLKVVQDGLDLGGVESEGHAKLGALQASRTKLLGNLGDLRSLSAQNGLSRAIDAGDVDPLARVAESLHDRRHGAHGSQHGMGSSRALINQQLCARSNHVDSVTCRQHASNVQCCVLA